jgi:hypothetical protein
MNIKQLELFLIRSLECITSNVIAIDPLLRKLRLAYTSRLVILMDKHPQGITVILAVLWSLTHQGSVFLDIMKLLHRLEDK